MRTRSTKFRLGLIISATLIGAGAVAPVATAAPAPSAQTVSAFGSGDARPGGGRFHGKAALGGVKVDKGSVRVGDRVCAGNCDGSVNGTNGGKGGICAGLCNGSANGGNLLSSLVMSFFTMPYYVNPLLGRWLRPSPD
ncbi:hypothetical protein ACWCYZ_21980, partial [Streptomyces virginiae]